MSVLLYAITDGPPPPPDAAALDQSRLRALRHNGLTAVVSDADGIPSKEVKNLWAYERVVERLMHTGTVIPARFGTMAARDEEITALLAERDAELTETLDRVRDAVEFAVHVAPAYENGTETETEDPAAPGTAYMNRLRAEDQGTQALDHLTRHLTRAKRRTRSGTAYLVPRADADTFSETTRALGLTLTGPWPPYSFVSVA